MKNYRTIAATLLVALLAGCPALAQPFRLGAEDAAGPWGREDGTGAGNEVVAAAFQAAEAEAELVVLPYARAKALAMEGELDGCFAMAWEPELEGRIVFGREPLYSVRAVVFENAANPVNLSSPEAARLGRTLGVVTGYEYPPEVYALKKKGIRFLEANSEEVNVRHLAAGRLDGALVVLDGLKNESFILGKAGVEGKVRRSFEAGGQGSYVGFSLKSPRGQKAKEAFDRGFAIIREKGVYQSIVAKWSVILEREQARAR